MEAILKLSTLYDISSGRDFAIADFSSRQGTDAARLLKMGSDYGVLPWFTEYFIHFVRHPLSILTSTQIARLGPRLLKHIIETRSQVEKARSAVLVEFPNVYRQAIEVCFQKNRDYSPCVNRFKKAWQSSARDPLLSDTFDLSIADIMEVFRKSLMSAGVCLQCMQYYLEESEGHDASTEDSIYKKGYEEAYASSVDTRITRLVVHA